MLRSGRTLYFFCLRPVDFCARNIPSTTVEGRAGGWGGDLPPSGRPPQPFLFYQNIPLQARGKGGAQNRPEAGSFRPTGSISTPTNAADTCSPFAFVTETFPALFKRTISPKIHMQSPCFYTHYTTRPEEENPLRFFSPGVFEKLIPTTEANIE